MIVVARMMVRGFNTGLPGKHLKIIAGETMIARVTSTCYALPWIQRVFLWTEQPLIASSAVGCIVITRSMDDVFYNGGYSDPNEWGEKMDKAMTNHLGGKPEIVLTLNANCCLIRGETLTAMFTRLMEHESASAITAVVPVAGGLVTPNPVKPDYMFPVWLQPGLDRQDYPKLYRVTGVRIQRHNRPDIHGFGLRELWHEISPIEGLDVQTEEDLRMARYFAEKTV